MPVTTINIILGDISASCTSSPNDYALMILSKNVKEISFRLAEIDLLLSFNKRLNSMPDLSTLTDEVSDISVEWYNNLVKDNVFVGELKDVLVQVGGLVEKRIQFNQNIIHVLTTKTIKNRS
ncbi:MAG: hypothetical protein UZ19_OD1000825 [Parcubacteria bacterium OLB19]|nr:MAG: hypothetical protein UZ19_OD1000825 [Parcubacteria bacterium OLB19]